MVHMSTESADNFQSTDTSVFLIGPLHSTLWPVFERHHAFRVPFSYHRNSFQWKIANLSYKLMEAKITLKTEFCLLFHLLLCISFPHTHFQLKTLPGLTLGLKKGPGTRFGPNTLENTWYVHVCHIIRKILPSFDWKLPSLSVDMCTISVGWIEPEIWHHSRLGWISPRTYLNLPSRLRKKN